jgi:hypothetical protein
MSSQIRPPVQRPLVPPFWVYFVVLLGFTAFTLALLYILLDSPA